MGSHRPDSSTGKAEGCGEGAESKVLVKGHGTADAHDELRWHPFLRRKNVSEGCWGGSVHGRGGWRMLAVLVVVPGTGEKALWSCVPFCWPQCCGPVVQLRMCL